MSAPRALLALASALALAACASPEANPTGGGGTTGTVPTPVMKDPSTYPQNTAGATSPYPQGHPSSYCTLAIYDTDAVALAYTNWKSRFYDATAGRIMRPENSNDTVSEGIGYGMLIGVYMNDQPMFDKLWAYAKSHFDSNGLMTWNLSSSGGVIGQGSATDGDEDMAWALIMAGKQWNSATYTNDAKTLINNLRSHALDGTTLKPGDNFGGASQTNPSYFAPSYYRAFARVTGDATWMSVLDQSYTILANASGSDGLVPNWVNSGGSGVNGPGSDAANGVFFGYDACRTPFRIAMDYCETGELRAKAYLDKIVGFYAMTAPTAINMLKDGYTTTGANPSSTLGDNNAGMAFYGPGGVGAMAETQAAFVKMTYGALVSQTTGGAMNAPGVYTYYNASWGVLSLLAMSGNFWDMAP